MSNQYFVTSGPANSMVFHYVSTPLGFPLNEVIRGLKRHFNYEPISCVKVQFFDMYYNHVDGWFFLVHNGTTGEDELIFVVYGDMSEATDGLHVERIHQHMLPQREKEGEK